MKFGAHISAAGGLHNAPLNAAALGLECFQFFSRPPQGGRVVKIAPGDAERFQQTCAEVGITDYYVHAPYVINLASKEKRIREASVGILREELARTSALGAAAMMCHVGSANGVGEEEGLRLVIDGVKRIIDGHDWKSRFLIEISAGAGMVIGDRFEEVRAILDGVGDDRVDVCFDTAHAFASGYDLRDEKAVAATMREFDHIVGLDRLMISHCNDSMVDIGERKDRHQHLGKGFIGKKGFAAIVSSPAFAEVNLILETPPDGVSDDLALLKSLRKQHAH
jgi:deoxyribonuclease-4